MSALEITDLTVRYQSITALTGVSLNVKIGEMVAVVGPNGSGKSTLFKTIIGLVRPTNGKILIFGREPRTVRGRTAYVPQKEEVYWDYPLTVWDLAAMGKIKTVGILKGVPKGDRSVAEALRAVGMEDLAERKISDLSGGQQQRAFLARSIVQGADLYLMDEPLAGLDADAEDKLFDVLLELKRKGKTIIMSTHDISSTLELFDGVLLLKGRVIAYGRPREVLTEENMKLVYGSERVAMHLGDVRRVAKWD
ncbi:MAG: metal ABC transporter ATP-binding protein [Aigarchaeota archaeon]|nr:metal ABC transporter ATP-binding protein [Aigarchaeota archaeon]MDW8093295.1 metal ABC transporter ATP-binding protein [Nitrososphaerota archaeon]